MGVYEDTLEDIEKTYGTIPGLMRVIPRDLLIRDWPSWKRDNLGEIHLERARYLLSTDGILEDALRRAE